MKPKGIIIVLAVLFGACGGWYGMDGPESIGGHGRWGGHLPSLAGQIACAFAGAGIGFVLSVLATLVDDDHGIVP